MKYTYFALFVIMMVLLVGCKSQTANLKAQDPYASVTVKNVRENCVPIESHMFTMFGVNTRLSRLEACAGVNDMFLVVWRGANGEIEQTIAKLVTLLYVDSNNDKDGALQLEASFIKNGTTEDGQTHGAFYELKVY